MKSRLFRLLRGLLLFSACVAILYTIPPRFRYDGPRWTAANRLATHLPQPPGRGPLPEQGGDLLIRNARLIDGTGAAPRDGVSILVRQGLIVRIGDPASIESELAPDRWTGPRPAELDAGGRTVMPGLIDGHVHIGMAPSSAVRMDSAEASIRLLRHHLKAYLANGITTIFDPAVNAEVAGLILRWRQEGQVGPRYYHLGPLMANLGGYTADIFPPGLVTAGDVEARLEEVKQSGAIGVKLAFERGMLVENTWVLLPEPLRAAIREGAARRNLPLYIHCMTDENCRMAMELEPRALVHVPNTTSDALLERLDQAKPFMVTTLARWDMSHIALHPELMEERLWKLTVPEEVKRGMFDPEEVKKANIALTGWSVPFLPGPVVNLLGGISTWRSMTEMTERQTRGKLAELQGTVKRLYDRGIPIVMGTDAGNHPILPMFFHGVLAQRELELLTQAGLSPAAVIEVSTRNGARMVGKEGELGTLEPGKRADMVILDGDPLNDPGAAMKTLRWTVFDGVAHTPEEWMAL